MIHLDASIPNQIRSAESEAAQDIISSLPREILQQIFLLAGTERPEAYLPVSNLFNGIAKSLPSLWSHIIIPNIPTLRGDPLKITKFIQNRILLSAAEPLVVDPWGISQGGSDNSNLARAEALKSTLDQCATRARVRELWVALGDRVPASHWPLLDTLAFSNAACDLIDVPNPTSSFPKLRSLRISSNLISWIPTPRSILTRLTRITMHRVHPECISSLLSAAHKAEYLELVLIPHRSYHPLVKLEHGSITHLVLRRLYEPVCYGPEDPNPVEIAIPSLIRLDLHAIQFDVAPRSGNNIRHLRLTDDVSSCTQLTRFFCERHFHQMPLIRILEFGKPLEKEQIRYLMLTLRSNAIWPLLCQISVDRCSLASPLEVLLRERVKRSVSKRTSEARTGIRSTM